MIYKYINTLPNILFPFCTLIVLCSLFSVFSDWIFLITDVGVNAIVGLKPYKRKGTLSIVKNLRWKNYID